MQTSYVVVPHTLRYEIQRRMTARTHLNSARNDPWVAAGLSLLRANCMHSATVEPVLAEHKYFLHPDEPVDVRVVMSSGALCYSDKNR